MLDLTKHRDVGGVAEVGSDPDVHHGFDETEIATDKAHVQIIIDIILNHGNPFEVPSSKINLHNIFTKVLLPQETEDQLLSMMEIGISKYDNFLQERLIEKSKTIFDTIHRTNQKTFGSSQTQTSKGTEKKAKSTESAEVQRLVSINFFFLWHTYRRTSALRH